MVGYSAECDPENSAKAIGKELNISPKKSMELCREIRGMHVEDAKEYLEEVIKMRRVVPFKRYNRDVPHRKGKGMMSGRYPVKVAKAILEVIESAEHNAEYKGLDSGNMRIAHIAASRGRVFEGRIPRARGRATQWNEETTNIEIILEELEE